MGTLSKSFDLYRTAVLDILKAAEQDPASTVMLLADVEGQFDRLSALLDAHKSTAESDSTSVHPIRFSASMLAR